MINIYEHIDKKFVAYLNEIFTYMYRINIDDTDIYKKEAIDDLIKISRNQKIDKPFSLLYLRSQYNLRINSFKALLNYIEAYDEYFKKRQKPQK